MCLSSKRFFVFLISVLTYCTANSQTFYWIGGSGSFNDPAHWSLSQEGKSANLIPNAASRVIFPGTGLSGEQKIIFNASFEVNSVLINTHDKIRFIHKVTGTRLIINHSFDNVPDNVNFRSEVIFEFKNDFTSNPGVINTGNSVLNADFIISSGFWKISQLKLSESNTLYIQKADVNFSRSVVEVGNLDLSGCRFLDFDHTILKVFNETRIKDCSKYSFKRAYLNWKFYDDKKPNDGLGSIAGRTGSQNQITSIPTPTVQRPTCSPGCDGNVIITLPPATSFTPTAVLPYNIIVDGSSCPGSPSSLVGVGPGTYTLTNFCGCSFSYIFYIQDALDDIGSTSTIVPVPSIFTNPSSGGNTNILCNGACTGAINLNYNTVGGSAPPYNFTVTPPGLASFTTSSTGSLPLTGLCAGTLTVLARDSLSCPHTFVRTYTQPTALNTNSVFSNIACNGLCTGSVSISPTGGNYTVGALTGYTVNFNPGGTFIFGTGGSASSTGLCPGPLSATVTDNKNCTVVTSTVVVQPPALTVTASQTSLSCNGVCDGSATLTTTGGVAPYTLTLIPSVGLNTVIATGGVATVTNLCAGNYTASIRDFNNCLRSQTFAIVQPPAVTVTPTFTNVTCNGGTTGRIVISTSGGNGGPYSFIWSPAPPSGQGTATVSNLPANPAGYTVNISYGNSCTASLLVPITQPPPATLTVLSQTISCFGTCNGSSSVIATGGNSAYTFTWSPLPPAGQGTGTISALCGGTSFTATVSDASLCVYPDVVVSVTQASSITPNIIASNLTCGAVCNGSITATPTGTAAFNYTLASSTSTITSAPPYLGLCPGNYTVFIRNLSTSCTQSSVTAIVAPPPLNGSLISTLLSCFNQCNGSLAGSAVGGTPGYTLSIATPTSVVPGGVLGSLCAGTYTLLITDANGCTNNTVTATLNQPPDITVTVNSTSMSCSTGCDGALSASIIGGTPGYTTSWSNGVSINPNINLCAGNYTLTVTDNTGCIKTSVSNVAVPLGISLTQATTAVSCAGGSNGSATITATGGSPSYTFQFNTAPPQTNTTGIASGLPQGIYIANVNDLNGCSVPITFTISAPPVLSAAITGTQNSCNVCIGAATVTANGGTPAYAYAWTNSLSASVGTASVVAGLCPGNYTVRVTDVRLCTTTQTLNIAQVVVVNLSVGGTSIQCFGACTGSAVAFPSSGTPPYLFSWTPGTQTTSTAVNLCAGIYNVLVTDLAGCTNTANVTIAQPPVLAATGSHTNATCNGTCNAAITTTVTGGSGPISYTWTPGLAGTPALTNVCAGFYTLNIRDANQCTLTIPAFTITQNALIVITNTVTNPSACIANNGSICVTASGGSGSGYTYAWSPVAGAASCLTGLSAGNYSVVVTDGVSCTNTISALVTNPTGPSVVVNTVAVACFGGSTGAATVLASGSGPFQFTWTPAVTFSTVSSSSTTASGLPTGTYVVFARDNNQCVTSQTVAIAQTSSITANQVIGNVRCNGANNGSIGVVPSGGTPGYTFNWLPGGLTGAGTGTVSGLAPGPYTVTIVDLALCSQAFTFSVTQPAAITLTNLATNVRCNAACNGSIIAGASGGTSPISYSWAAVGTFTGATTASVFNLCPNIYTVTAIDGNSCAVSNVIVITQPTAITSTLILKNATCSNSCNAIATHSVSGGTPGYVYSWSSAALTTSVLGGLCAGNYTGTVTDLNGCVLSKGFIVTPPIPFSLSLLPTNPRCNAACNGSIATTLSGSQGTVSFNWLPAGSGQNPTGLCPGNYNVTATDDSLCVAVGVVTLVNPPALIAAISTTNASCASACNGTVSVSAVNSVGTSVYSYTPALPGLPLLTSVCSGSYALNITDGNGCQANATFALIDPPVLSVNPSTNPSSCSFPNGSITINVVGGTPGYSYNWLPPVVSTNSMVSGLAAGLYQVVVTDSKNCTNTVTIPLSNSNGPSFVPIVSTSLNCNAQCIGAASVNVAGIIGGTPPYNVSWLPPAPSTLNPLSGLCAGNYTAQVTDFNNCVLFTGVSILQPPAVLLSPSFVLPSCNGICDGSISLNPSGGIGPSYTFTWFPVGPTGPVLTGACAGTYTIFVGDNWNNCIYQQNVILPSQLNISVNTSITPNQCFGDCNATATAFNATGGVPPYTFNWSNGQSGANATNLCNGFYSLIVTDANGCFNSFNVSITSGSPISSTVSVTSPSCNLCNGASSISSTGGGGSFQYNWSTGSTLSAVSGLCAGIYQVQVIDLLLGCRTTETVIVNSSTGITGENFNVQSVTCNNTCNGSATVTALGGTSPFIYNWVSPAVTNSAVSGLCAGVYFVQMTDAQGCLRTSSVTINPAASLSLTSFVTAPSCSLSNGAISVIIAGGTPGYAVSWNPPVGATPTVTGLGQGSYSITVTESGPGACSLTQQINLSNSTGPVIAVTQTNINCFNACTGIITATATGASPFTFNWSVGGTSSTVSNLCKGVVTLTVTDVNNCVSIRSFTVTDNPPIQNGVPQITQPTCNLCNGVAVTDIFGGTLPYTYTWTTGALTSSLSGLCAGLYQVAIRDVLGCGFTETVVINNSTGITGETFTVQGLPCAGTCNGSATVSALGGSLPITYNWVSPAVSNSVITNLCSGNYFVQMTDAVGCVRTSSVAIAPATVLSITPSFVPPGCQMNNGSIVVAISGGTPAYLINWAPGGATTPTLSGIGQGSYTVTVTESGPNNCSVTQQINLSNTTGPVVTGTQTNINCFNACTGVITASATGVSPLTYSWSVGGNSPTVTNLCKGIITLTVSDGNNCRTIRSFTITDNPQLQMGVPAVTDPTCNQCNGAAIVNVSGGILPYTYTWTTGATGPAVNNLCAGLYQVEVTDALGCTQIENIIINNSTGITGETFNVTGLPCSGNCIGSVTVAAIGGSAPVVYNWINPATSNSVISNLCAGSYFVQMVDAQGCIRTSSVAIAPVTNLSITPTIVPPGCSLNNGSIIIGISGGTPSYSISWSPVSNSTATLSNIFQGSYTVTVTESGPNNCSTTRQINVNNTTGPVIAATQTNINCFNACTGIITATATGVSPLTFNWSVGGSSSTVSNLCKGVVTLTVTDGNSCVSIRSFTITDNPQILLGVSQITQPTCNMCNGAAIVNAVGGTLPYTYTWTTAVSGPSVTNLCAGLYQVDVTDALGCSQTQNLIINNSSGITGQTFSVQGLPCSGTCNGSATVAAIGANAPFVYNWVNPATTNSVISNLCAGNYFVQMTDAQGCIRTAFTTIDAVTTLSITPTVLPPGCSQNNGSVIIAISGGTPAYNIAWAPGSSTTPTLSNVGFGSYTVTVTESGPNNCSVTQQINLSNTTGPVVTGTQTNINCFNACTGVITASATGVSPLTYSWSVGGNSPTVTNLCKGIITLTVSDGNNCRTIRSFTITDNPQLQMGVPAVTDPICNQCNGAAIVNVSGGILPYTYTWTTGATGPAVNNLCAGLYQVEVTDALGCTQIENIIINNSTGITGETFNVTGLPCSGNCIGSVTVAAIGGSAPVVYNWINPATSNSVISNLCAGSYFVQMVDAQGCIRTSSVAIAPVTNLSITPTIVPPGCSLNNGSIIIGISGGTPSYSISWSPVSNSTATLSNIFQGSYTVTVTESGPNNCSTTRQINVNNTTGPVIAATQTNINCFNACTGIITATATGVSPLTFNWSVGGSSSTVSNLCKGVVTLTVTDGNSCVSIRSFTITDNPQILLGVSQITQPTCNMCNGAAIVNAVGGTLPYTYTWTTAVSGPSVTNLCAGLYQVDVTDALGCSQTQNLIINNSSGITGQTFSVQGLPCSGTCNGSATVAAIGANAPFVYNWVNPATTNSVISNLCAGNYFVQMTDAQGCIRTAFTTIDAVTTLSITPTVLPPGCSQNNGSVIIAISGGTPAYNIAWAPGSSTTPTLSNVGFGSYTVTVTESGPNNCSVTQQINLSNTTGPVVTGTQTNINCFNACTGVITASATGVSPLTYSWSVGGNSPTVTNLCKGIITLTVSDGNNCRTIRSFTITDNPQLQMGVPAVTDPICNQCNGAAIVNVSGGILPYTYTWTTGATGPAVNNLCAGLYQVEVTDALGCTQIENIIINNSTGITGETFNVTGLPCSGNCIGSVTVAAIGGSAPVVYNWINPATSNSVISNLCAGSYFVQMVDAQGCIRTSSVAIAPVTNLSITPTIVPPGCSLNNGSIIIGISGGTPSYSISWSPVSNSTATLSNIFQGSYTVTVTESGPNNCSTTRQINVNNTTGPVIAATQTNINCFNACTGIITATATGVSPLTFNWSVGGSSSTVSNLCKGVVTLTVTDGNSCVSIRSFTITDNPQILLGVSQITQPTCNMCNGAAIVNAVGGTLPYTYTWTTAVSGPSVTNLCAGLYQVDVTDALGCSQTQNLIINNSSGITGQTFSVQGLPCSGTCNGSATVAAIGANAPFVYNWVNPATTNSVISNLCAGNYFLQMIDAQGCIRSASVTIDAVTTLSLSSSIVQPGCQSFNGSIVLSISGGTPTYNIAWAPGSNNTPTLSGIGQGSYSVTVTESGPNNCSLTQQINISNLTGPVVAATQTNVSCFGDCSGAISAVATGIGPFSYNWSVGGNTSAISNLCSGVITLTVTDFSNCITIRTFTINENTPLLASAPQITPPLCNMCNGAATINAFGGTLPYTYVWTTGANGQVASGLCAGLYQVLVTDNLGCQKTQNVVINNSSGITGETFSVLDELCFKSCNGSATVAAIGGASPVSYNWINPPVTGSVINNLCGGDYFVQMTDANGCIRTASVMVNSATNLLIDPLIVQPSCGASNGSVSILITGGTAPFVYSWLPSGSTSSSLNNLGAGSYTLTVTDKNGAGCSKTQLVNISSFNAPTIAFTQTNISCFNACTGALAALASGTASPFTYNWSTGASLPTVSNLCKGVVILTVTASNGCVSMRSFTLTDNPELELSMPNIIIPGCVNSCNGAITLIPSGGSLPYSFGWLPAGTGNPAGSLCAGTYTSIITDAKGCVNSSTVQLKNPAPISVTATPVNSSCSSIADGSISIVISGGTPSYTFAWTGPGAFTSGAQNVSNLLSGNYSLTLSDNAGCKRDTLLTLVPTITVNAVAGRDTVICSTGFVILTGTNSIGVSQYSWFELPGNTSVANTPDFAPPVSAGSATYVLLTLSSVPNCLDRDTVVIKTFPEIIVDAGADALIPVFSNVTIGGNPTIQGAVSFTWSPTFSLSDPLSQNPVASNTVNITYTIVATDINGCTASDTVKVDLYPEVKISNGFSPNGDGKNDTWIIDYIDQFPQNTVEIYNRWGERLFYSQGYSSPFNGQYRGKDLPVGTYYYVINLNHPAYTKPYTGPLTIFR